MTARPPGGTGNRKRSSSRLPAASRPMMSSSRSHGRCFSSFCSLHGRRKVVVPSLTGQRPWALSLYSCPLSSPPSRTRSESSFRAPSRRSFRFAGCKSANAAERSTNSGSATAVPVASSHCLKASASTRRRWSGPSPPSLPLASSCSGCSSGPPCGAALALPQRPALKNSASEPVLKPGSSQLLAVHELRGTLVRPHSRPLGRMAGLRS